MLPFAITLMPLLLMASAATPAPLTIIFMRRRCQQRLGEAAVCHADAHADVAAAIARC